MKFASAKVVFVGDMGTGKTSLMNAILEKDFVSGNPPTSGATRDLLSRESDGISYEFSLWDTGGQEKYLSLTSLYVRSAAIAIVCYDITFPESFAHLDGWIQLVADSSPNANFIIVGTKRDLIVSSATVDNRTIVPLQDLIRKAETNGYAFIETSAVTKQGVDGLMKLMEVAAMNATTSGLRETSAEIERLPHSCCHIG
jgi:small GTP-binding protein